MYLIPLKPVANQTTTTVLGGQIVRVAIREMTTGVYLSAWLDNVQIQSGILCVDRVRMMDANYDGFVGALMFMDSQGTSNPEASGIGTRWNLYYLESGE
jgi:hypothetical protein